VSGANPIRSIKLEFDKERTFRERLCPASADQPVLSTDHDWKNVRALKLAPAPDAGPDCTEQEKRRSKGV
jgi:hypothetical protein